MSLILFIVSRELKEWFETLTIDDELFTFV